MKPVPAGASAEIDVLVTPEMTAALDGELIHDVYATFWLAHHAEVAARRLLELYLDDGEDGIGYEVRVRHTAPTLVGERVRVRARFEALSGNRLVCSIVAENPRGVCADGEQTQVVLPHAALARRIDAIRGGPK